MGYAGYGWFYSDEVSDEYYSDQEITLDYFDFLNYWPRSEWPEGASSFHSASIKGKLISVKFHTNTGFIFSTKSISSPPQINKYHSCEYVNVSFNHITMACRVCGREK